SGGKPSRPSSHSTNVSVASTRKPSTTRIAGTASAIRTAIVHVAIRAQAGAAGGASATSSDAATSLACEEQARLGRREPRYQRVSGRPRTTHGAPPRTPGTWKALLEG